jgi:mono/diheme cytochrome c family protein
MSTLQRFIVLILFGSFFFLLPVGETLGKDPAPLKKTPQLLSEGKKLYERDCVACHGAKGDGKGPAAAALKPEPSDFADPLNQWPNTKGKPEKIFEVISKGIPNSAMVKWDQLSEKERWGLTYFVMEFAKSSPSKKK